MGKPQGSGREAAAKRQDNWEDQGSTGEAPRKRQKVRESPRKPESNEKPRGHRERPRKKPWEPKVTSAVPEGILLMRGVWPHPRDGRPVITVARAPIGWPRGDHWPPSPGYCRVPTAIPRDFR